MTVPTPAATPDLLYSQDEEDLRLAVRALLADRAAAPTVIAATESDTPYDPRLWSSLAADIGAAGLLVPEKLGGQGASHREAAVVVEELGRSVAPAPYLTSSVVATETLLASAAVDGPAAALLGELASGARTAVLAVPFATPPAGCGAGPRRARRNGPGHRRRGGRRRPAGADRRRALRGRDLGPRGRRGIARPARPDPPARRRHPDRGDRDPAGRRGQPAPPPYGADCSPGPDCSPPNSSGSPNGV